MIHFIRKNIALAYARFLTWKWDRELIAAERRFQGCAHDRTMFVDVGSPPYDCIEKCCDCWALRVPKLGRPAASDEMEWTPNSARPSRTTPATRRAS